jgi:hypothetical protein
VAEDYFGGGSVVERVFGRRGLASGPIEEGRGGVDELRQHCLVASGLGLSVAAALLAAEISIGNDSGITLTAALASDGCIAWPGDPPVGRAWRKCRCQTRYDCSPC